MKKTSKRIIAIALAVIMTLSVYTVGAVSIASLLQSNTITQTANGSNIINANSIEEALQLMESNPDFFAAPAGNAKAAKDSVIYPTIIIPGISQSISYVADEDGYPAYNSNGEELSGGLLILDTSNLVPTIVNNLAAPLVRALIRQDDKDKALQNATTKTVKEVFAIQASDNEGNPVNNLKTVEYKTSVKGMSQDDRDYFYRMIPMQTLTEGITDVTTGEVIQEPVLDESLLYLYAFPLIGDPMNSAAKLDEYIQFVKKDTGLDKVNIVTISLGGTILTAYMELMKDTGYTDLNRIINVVSCLQGTDVMGDFYMREFKINDPEHPEYEEFFFNDFLPMVMRENSDSATLGYIINIALKIMPKEVVYSILTGAVDGIVESLMLKCPQFWAMIPTDRFEDVKAKYNFLWEDPDTYGVLTAKLDAFQEARVNLIDNLKEFNKDGRLVQNVAAYDLSYAEQDYNFFGAMRSSDVTNSDGIIDVDSTTLGATYAKAGTVLPDDILFSDDAIVSPDGSVDVSTCAFPQNVWLFHGQYHEVGRNDVVLTLVGKLISGEIKTVADCSDKFPQFNGNRNTRNIRRWNIGEAEDIINAYDASTGTTIVIKDDKEVEVSVSDANMASLISAYKDAIYLLDDTICEPTAAESVTKNLETAIYRVGNNGQEPAEEDTSTASLLEAIVAMLEDVLTAVFGPGYGFSEIAENGVLAD